MITALTISPLTFSTKSPPAIAKEGKLDKPKAVETTALKAQPWWGGGQDGGEQLFAQWKKPSLVWTCVAVVMSHQAEHWAWGLQEIHCTFFSFSSRYSSSQDNQLSSKDFLSSFYRTCVASHHKRSESVAPECFFFLYFKAVLQIHPKTMTSHEKLSTNMSTFVPLELHCI